MMAHAPRVLRCIAAFAICLGSATAAQADDPGRPDAPQLRIEPDAHTALIREAVFDARSRRLYSVSDDKTVRVWQLPQGRLIDTWRVPIAPGHEGQLFGVSLSPDSRWLAVGGYTCWTQEKKSCVYLFDTRSGALSRRISVAPHTITTLRFSPDARHLAVGLHGQGGLAVVDLSDGRVVATDTEYRGKLMALDFDHGGHLVTVSLDGFVRYYRADYSLLARRATRAARAPTALAFSPDGSMLAIGFIDAPVVELLRGDDLSPLQTLHLPAARLNNSVAVEWSDVGDALFASGEAPGTARQAIARFRVGHWDQPRMTAGPVQRINDLLATGDGRLLFVSEDPGLGWIERSGQLRWISRPALIDFSAPAHGLTVSANGEQVSFPLGRDGARARYDVRQAKVLRGAGGGGAALRPSLEHAPGLVVQIDRAGARINGRAIALDEAEEPRLAALSHDGRRAYIGTEWSLRAVNADATPAWVAPLNATVHAVNATSDGRYVLALLGDGTLRWFRSDDGREVLALFIHANRRDWISWTPAGHYASSPLGDQYIGWHLNRGADTAPDFIRAVQLERVLYRPDRVGAALDADVVPNAGAARASEPTLQRERLQSVAPPRVQVQVVRVDADRASALLAVQVERAGSGGPGIRDLAVYVNDIPVVATRERSVGVFERASLKREFSVPLSQPWNEIRVEAFTDSSIGLARTGVALAGAPQAPPPGDLYLLAIGASHFEQLGEQAELAYAAKDAEVLATELGASRALSFRQRHVRVLSDASATPPTRANIVAALDFIAGAQANDTVLVFLASHGVADAAGNYFFVPSDARAQDMKGRVAVTDAASLLSWQVFFDALRKAAGRRVLVVDTCAAKGIAGPIEATALIKRSASSHFALMLASGENEESQEYEAGGHGLFTFGLLSVLRAAGDGRGLTLNSWFQDTLPIVQRFRDHRIGPQTPQLLAPESLMQMPLAATPF